MGFTRHERPALAPLGIALAIASGWIGWGCKERGAPRRAPPAETSASARGTALASSSARATPTDPATSRAIPRREPPEPDRVVEARADGGLAGLVLQELSDVGPAGPATATPDGVLLLAKSDRLHRAVAAKGPIRNGNISPLQEPPSAFRSLGRGPAVAGGHAHWVSGGRLLRQRADGGGEPEVLAAGARDGSRVAAVATEAGVAVAYLGRHDEDGTSHAMLHLGPGRILDATPDGAGASSVSLALLGKRLLVVFIDGRSAMTPLHARTVTFGGPKGAELDADVVVWVAGPSHSFTEVTAATDGKKAWALLPIERDTTHFGLATVSLEDEPRMDAPVTFLDYPNGIDLAPVATATLCGSAHAAIVRPTLAAPRSPQELVLWAVGGSETTVIANAAGFAGVSLAAAPGGGLVVYVADGRTWARGLRCL